MPTTNAGLPLGSLPSIREEDDVDMADERSDAAAAATTSQPSTGKNRRIKRTAKGHSQTSSQAS